MLQSIKCEIFLNLLLMSDLKKSIIIKYYINNNNKIKFSF